MGEVGWRVLIGWLIGWMVVSIKRVEGKCVEVEIYLADENRTKYFCIIYNVVCNQKVTFKIRLR